MNKWTFYSLIVLIFVIFLAGGMDLILHWLEVTEGIIPQLIEAISNIGKE